MEVFPEDEQKTTGCLHCDSEVSEQFARVFGDNSGEVHRCRNCDTSRRLHEGSAADLPCKTPDPETNPGRHGDGDSEGQEEREMREFVERKKDGLWPESEVEFA